MTIKLGLVGQNLLHLFSNIIVMALVTFTIDQGTHYDILTEVEENIDFWNLYS